MSMLYGYTKSADIEPGISSVSARQKETCV